MRDRLLQPFVQKSSKSLLLLGPRQVGKSTLCQSLRPDLAFNLADEELYLSFSKDSGRLKREISVLKRPSLILVDEIQRVPALLNSVQALMDPGQDAKVRHRFLLTGSSARKLRQAGANLLPGRVLLMNLDPLTFREAGAGFELERALSLGMLPGIYWGDEDAAEVLRAYADIYLREEIRAEAAVKDLGQYARFLDVIALSSGQWLNYSKLASDTEIPKETIRRYVSLLEDTLMIFRVPAFQARTQTSRRIAQRDKVLLFDIGVRNALLGLHRRKLTADQRGPAFEHWLGLQLIYLGRALRKDWKVSSYRSEGGAEVDFVLEHGDEVMGIEVKSGRNVDRTDLRGLQSLGEILGKKARYRRRIAYLGERAQKFDDGTEALPFLELLEEVAEL